MLDWKLSACIFMKDQLKNIPAFPGWLGGWGWAACRSTHNPDARLSTFTLCLFDLHIAISKNSQSHPKNAHGQLAGVFINGKHLGVLIDFKHALDPTPNAFGSPPGLSSLGLPWHHQILADHLTPSQPEGGPQITTCLLYFQTFRHPCITAGGTYYGDMGTTICFAD